MTTATSGVPRLTALGLGGPRVRALIAIPCIALTMGIGAIAVAASEPEPITVAACNQYNPYMNCMM